MMLWFTGWPAICQDAKKMWSLTDERESPQKALSAWENSSHDCIESVHAVAMKDSSPLTYPSEWAEFSNVN